MNKPSNQDSVTFLQLKDIVDEVVDTVATFDGRFAYQPMSSNGQCILTFKTTTEQIELQIESQVQDNHVEITLQIREDDGVIDNSTVFRGDFSPTEIRYTLGTKLADWYGRMVRHQFPD